MRYDVGLTTYTYFRYVISVSLYTFLLLHWRLLSWLPLNPRRTLPLFFLQSEFIALWTESKCSVGSVWWGPETLQTTTRSAEEHQPPSLKNQGRCTSSSIHLQYSLLPDLRVTGGGTVRTACFWTVGGSRRTRRTHKDTEHAKNNYTFTFLNCSLSTWCFLKNTLGIKLQSEQQKTRSQQTKAVTDEFVKCS